jgi:hypothetical protein
MNGTLDDNWRNTAPFQAETQNTGKKKTKHFTKNVAKRVSLIVGSCHFKPIFRALNTMTRDRLSPLFLHQ